MKKIKRTIVCTLIIPVKLFISYIGHGIPLFSVVFFLLIHIVLIPIELGPNKSSMIVFNYTFS